MDTARSPRRRRLVFANLASALALAVALSGGAYALTIPKNSVGTQQLKKDAVNSSRVKDGALQRRDLAPGARSPGAMVPIALLVVREDGEVASEVHRAPVTSAPIVDAPAGNLGNYFITFPGFTMGEEDVALCNSRQAFSMNGVEPSSGTLSVHVVNDSGDAVPEAFQCAVYDLAP